jgi:hypothetical protein
VSPIARRKCDAAHKPTRPQENGTKNTASADAWIVQKMMTWSMEGSNGHISRRARPAGIRSARSAGRRPPAAPISAADLTPPARRAGVIRNVNATSTAVRHDWWFTSTPARAVPAGGSHEPDAWGWGPMPEKTLHGPAEPRSSGPRLANGGGRRPDRAGDNPRGPGRPIVTTCAAARPDRCEGTDWSRAGRCRRRSRD